MVTENNMICDCGHDCSRCVTYLATIRDDEALRAKARAFYLREFGIDLPLERVCCYGGRSEKVLSLCADCPWQKCRKERGLPSCEACEEYPCAPLSAYREKYVNRCNQEDRV